MRNFEISTALPAYQKAFVEYLRRGTSIDLTLEQVIGAPSSTYYVWHTQKDGKVRPSHAANDGKVFSWDNPPATGNPGEDFNCRCWAEPLGRKEYATQLLISDINDTLDQWTNWDFVVHYFFGNHVPVTLQQTGYLEEIINYFAKYIITVDGQRGMYQRVNQQIINEALRKGEGSLTSSFSGTYNFEEVLYTFRNSSVYGSFMGDVRREDNFLVISGVVSYEFSDKFKDPLSFVEALQRYRGMTRGEAEAYVRERGDAVGKPYDITDHWQTKFNATVKA